MDLERFKTKLFTLGTVSDESWDAFANCLEYKEVKKNAFLTQEGSVEDSIYFVLKGAIIVYVANGDKEVVTNFRFENEFTSSITSFLLEQPSQYFLKCMTDSAFLVLKRVKLYWLYNNYLDINTLGRVVMEKLLIDKRQRELDFLTLNAEERYKKLLDENPEYVQNIQLKQLASFLGIAPESLSRIRAKR